MQLLMSEATLYFIFLAIFGMLCHAAKKWADGEIRGGLVDWYVEHPRRSVAAILACVGSVFAAILSGTISDPDLGSHILSAWLIGFGSDTFNGQRKPKVMR